MNDLRYAIRQLLKKPAFTAVAVLSLALGIGANTAVFSVVNAMLIKSLPYDDADRLVLVWGEDRARDRHRSQISFTDSEDWRKQSSTLEELSSYGDWRPLLAGAGESERVGALQVADGFFAVMKGRPLLGRTFLPEEQQEGKDFVVVLSYALWQRKFGGDAEVIGKSISLNSRPYTIIGVMGPDFHSLPSTLIDQPAELYRPVAEPYEDSQRDARHLRAIARLKAGIDIAQAQAELSVLASAQAERFPKENAGRGVRLVSLREDMIGDLRPALLMLMGAVVFVLMIACANVGNLLIARSTARQKEIAIRAALGAGRARLARQFLTESVLLALAGGAAGLLLAYWGKGIIESLGAKSFPLLGRVDMNLTVLAFTLGVSILTGLVFGSIPALKLSQPDLNETLKAGGRSGGEHAGHRLRSLLVVSEMAMAIVLIVCAALLIKSISKLREVDPGFNPERVLKMSLWLPGAKYPESAQVAAFYNQAIERIESLPGVEAAAVVSTLPTGGSFDTVSIEVEGQTFKPGDEPDPDRYIITPDYFKTMGIKLARGRLLTTDDSGDAQPVVLVSETMAETLWPGEDPIGKRIKSPGPGPREQWPWRAVVGVVGDVKQYGLDKATTMALYLPHAQTPFSFMTLVVKTATDPMGHAAAIRHEILSIDPDQAAFDSATLDDVLTDSISLRRFAMLLLSAFAGVALMLAAAGIYGVISYSVSQRTREIGIRLALGGQSSHVLRLILRQGMTPALIGVAAGLAASFTVTRLMTTLLFGVSATDPVMFAATAALLIAVAAIACYVPARRAMKVDPMIALRYE